jgi:CheY-like chemotaxis protein
LFTEKGKIEFGYINKETSIEFFVEDTGIGIPKDKQLIIYDRFVQADLGLTRSYEGAGLGLSISKAYVEMLGGILWVDSDEGKGTKFSFTVPLNEETLPKFPTGQKADLLKKSAKKEYFDLHVLVAEDDKITSRYIKELLRCKKISFVETGVDAVEFCRKNSDVDMVLMDIKLPEMDGYTATGKIREFNQNIKIIAQTAFAFIEDQEKAIAAGCNDCIPKPYKIDALHDIIRKNMR